MPTTNLLKHDGGKAAAEGIIVRPEGMTDAELIAKLGLPVFRLAPSTEAGSDAPIFGMFPRTPMRRGARPITGQLLLALGLVEADPDAGDVAEGVIDCIVYDERHRKSDVAQSALHRKAMRLLCGEDGVALLEAAPVRRITTSAWLLTGGDVVRAEEGAIPCLHTLRLLEGVDGEKP